MKNKLRIGKIMSRTILTIILFNFTMTHHAIGQHSADSTALMALYNATNGPNWNNNTNWGTSAPLDQWYGISTRTSNGSVTKIELNNNDLNGFIPKEIGSFTLGLQSINLSSNQLTDTIPKEIANQIFVQDLDLSSNQLTGAIPKEIMDLIYLDELNLADNQLTGSIPSEIGQMTNLMRLFLQHNNLTGVIPTEMGNLSNIDALDLTFNQFTKLPPDLTNCVKLYWAKFSDNQISGEIPASYINHPTMIPVFVNNMLVFEDFKNAKSGANPPKSRIQGYVYETQKSYYDQAESHTVMLGSIQTLTTSANDPHNTYQWFLNGTALTGETNSNLVIGPITPADTGEYTLRVRNSVFTALTIWREPVQVNLCQSDSCVLMTLYNSTDGPNWKNNTNWGTSAPLDQWNGVTTNNDGRVTSLILWNERLTGTIPSEIGMLDELTHLALASNNLSGTIPKEIGSLANLTDLSFQGNALAGEIPKELANALNLVTLSLQENNLSGTIPKEIYNLTNLTELYLNDNNLTGNIANEIGNLTSLEELYLSANQFTGNIPTSIGNLTKLERLVIHQNNFTGKVPIELQTLTNLKTLYLHENQFNHIDRGLNLPSLIYVMIGNNQFDFEDLEVLNGQNLTIYSFSNQTAVYNTPLLSDGTIGWKDTLAIFGATAPGNQFQWYKDGVAIVDATDSTYVIDPITLDHAGTYTVKVTNTTYASETFYREPINYIVTLKPLPVVLTEFKVEEQFGDVFIQWTTESEINSDYFEILRSEDGLNWNHVVTVAAHGNSNVKRHYETVDNNPHEGVSYYRLKQVDYNGVFELFDPKAVEIKSENLETRTEVYPSPFKDELFIKVEGTNEPVNIQVFTTQGQLVHSQTIFGNDSHFLDLDNNLPTGIYMVSYQIKSEFFTKKVVKN